MRHFPLAARSKVPQAAAIAGNLHVRPSFFCDSQSGMHHFAQTIFEMGQSVPENEIIDLKSYLPGRTAVTNAVNDLSYECRQDFTSELRKGSLQYGGSITIDGAHLKV